MNRALGEFFVIVLGVLVALGADAWNEGRLQRAEEQELLRGLRSEFVANRDQAASVVGAHLSHARRFAWLQTAPVDSILILDSVTVQTFHRALEAPYTFDPQAGALTALVSSGKLGLVQEDELRTALGEWLSELSNIEETRLAMANANEAVLRAMGPHGGPFQRWPDQPGRGHYEPLPAMDAVALAAVRDDDRVMGAARHKHRNAAIYVATLQQAIEVIESVVAMIDASIDP